MTSLFSLLLAAFEPLKNDYLARVEVQADLESREIIEKWKNDFLRILKNSAQFAEKFRIKNDKLIAETTDKDYIKRLKHEKNYWNKEYANCAKRENESKSLFQSDV